MQLIPQHTGFLDFKDVQPLIFGPTAFEVSSRMLSLKQPQPANSIADVMDSFLVFNYIVVICCILSIICVGSLLRIAQSIRPKKHMRIWWNLLSAICQQPQFSYSFFSMRVVAIFYVLEVFWVTQYYEGNFSTDLTIRKDASDINSIEDLDRLDNKRVTTFMIGDTTKAFCKNSKIATLNRIYKRHDKEFLAKNPSALIELDLLSANTALKAIRRGENVLFGLEQTRITLTSLHCIEQSQTGYANKVLPLYTGKVSYNSELRAVVFNRNIRPVLRTRLHKRMQRLFEAFLWEKGMSIDAPRIIAEGFETSYDFNFTNCFFGRHFEASLVEPHLELQNTHKLYYCLFSGSLLAFCIVVLEFIRGGPRSRRRQNIAKRMKAGRTPKPTLASYVTRQPDIRKRSP